MMLTLFTAPKHFRGRFDLIQRNAIESWQRLRPACEIILMGDDEATASVAQEFGVLHVPQIARNEYGTPLVNCLFAEAERVARYPHLCYINADIILMSDFLPAVRQVVAERSRFLLVGRRSDLNVSERLDFINDWEANLRLRVKREGKLHAHTGLDYFVFPRGLGWKIPPFAIGRPAWDSWLLYRAISQGVSVIDLTEMVTVVHQNHDYSHVAGGADAVWVGPEAKRNLDLAGGYAHAFTVWDAKYRLTRKGIQRRLTPYYFYRQLVTLSASHRGFRWLLQLVRAFR